MKRSIKVLSLVAAGFYLVPTLPVYAHAYLDVGSGSMMLQLLLAGTAGVGVLAKLLLQRLSELFKTSRSFQETK